MHRQVVLDTETTGLKAEDGHAIIEIGCLELVDRVVTGEQFHVYINPNRPIDKGAQKVHGITEAFLKDKPRFTDVLDDFLAFIKGSELIIHNAPFDIGFLDVELARAGHNKKVGHYCEVIDTLVMAKKKHPGQRNNLDALCKRYHVINSHRKLHGALLDSELLAFVYLAMTGGQSSLFNDTEESNHTSASKAFEYEALSSTSPVIYASENELKAHQAFLDEH